MSNTVLITLFVVAAIAILLVVKAIIGGNRTDPDEAKQLVLEGAQLVDVRTPKEYAGQHLDGATNIPVSEIDSRYGELSREKPVVVYCRSGARSSRAAAALRGQGFEVHDLGPMSAW